MSFISTDSLPDREAGSRRQLVAVERRIVKVRLWPRLGRTATALAFGLVGCGGDVVAQLHALAALSVFSFSDSSLAWHSQACVTDASKAGLAVMSTPASSEAQRSEASCTNAPAQPEGGKM